ncbi:Tyrosinase [Lasiodiplodia theobromae]|nr:Tyrosinase [Lasiodiplodia theobromae]
MARLAKCGAGLLGVLALAPTTDAAPYGSNAAVACERPIVRKEWRTLRNDEKLEYLAAVQCFLTKPPITPKAAAPGVGSRFEDLVATHINQGHFLAWHRWFTAIYERGLRNECGYTGAQPYWDWTLDVASETDFLASPVFDPILGFGGNGLLIPLNTSDPLSVPGRTGGGCIQDGPFANLTVNLGPLSDLSGNPRCLARDFSPYFAGRYLGMNQTQVTLSQPDFGWFDRVVEGGPSFDASGVHGGGHYGVGGTYGQMGDLYASPSDVSFLRDARVDKRLRTMLPIFYMHHCNLDRVWWSWQAMDLEARLTDISGPIYLMDYDNAQGGNVTLDFPLSVGVNAENVTVGDVMDIRGGVLCYEYDQLYSS